MAEIQKMSFAVGSENITLEEAIDNLKFAKVRIRAFASGDNAHNVPVSPEVLRRRASTIIDTPLTWVYNRRTDDIGEHADYEIPCGFVPNAPDSVTLEEGEDGRLWLIVEALIWKQFCGNLLEILKRDDGIKPVSVVMNIIDKEMRPDGKEEVLDFAFFATTLLGTNVRPAVQDAEMQVMRFQADKEEYEEKFGKYDDIDFTIPKKVQENARVGLELRKKYGRGGTSVGMGSARRLSKGGKATPEFARKVAKYFPRHEGDNLNDKTSNGWIAWQLWGGHAGWRWAQGLVDRMNKRDEKKMSFAYEFKSGDFVSWNSSGGRAYGRIEKIVDDGEVPKIPVKITGSKESPAALIRLYRKEGDKYEMTDKYVGHKLDTLNEAKMSFAKDDYGTEPAIKVDLSKEAMSDDAWGDVDKISLRNKILKASNYKTLVDKCYMQVEEGWEDAPSTKLGYPVCQIKSGKLVYNRGGLSSALGYAKANDESSVVSKLEAIYKKLDIGGEEDKMGKKMACEKYGMPMEMIDKMAKEYFAGYKYQMEEVECPKYRMADYDEDYMYCEDMETKKMVCMPYAINEGVMMADMEKMRDCKMVCRWIMEEMEDYDSNDDVYMRMTADAYSESAALAELNERTAEEYKALADEYMGKMQKAEEERDSYKSELEKMQNEQKKQMVEFALQDEDVLKNLSKDKIEELRMEAEKFSVGEIDSWITKVNSEAFLAGKGKEKPEGFQRMGLPVSTWGKNDNEKKSLWAD